MSCCALFSFLFVSAAAKHRPGHLYAICAGTVATDSIFAADSDDVLSASKVGASLGKLDKCPARVHRTSGRIYLFIIPPRLHLDAVGCLRLFGGHQSVRNIGADFF